MSTAIAQKYSQVCLLSADAFVVDICLIKVWVCSPGNWLSASSRNTPVILDMFQVSSNFSAAIGRNCGKTLPVVYVNLFFNFKFDLLFIVISSWFIRFGLHMHGSI